ncbi:MAG: serine/threonine protein kinase [Gemmatimonadota bacterium]|nr:serine/threonine protein kinase [Gemmatimonadota bacterium]
MALSTDRGDLTIAGRYDLVRELGHGSFGRTFLARERTTDRPVAIKVLDRRGAADWKAHELFEREATVLRSLRHHGVPEVHDLFRDVWDGAPAAFLVMEYVEGASLGQMIDEQRQLEPAEVVHVFLELLGILDYLHGRVPPVLHRDLKPSNIILRPDGAPALVDFGSVRRVFLGAEEAGSTVAGTYGYMPYEQYMGQASPASDLYALGATFLHLVTGRPPRDFMTPEGRIQVPDPLPGDPRLTPVLARMLRSSPAERFACARDVRHAVLAPVPAVATVASRVTALTRSMPDVTRLGPAPRAMEGPTAELLDRVAPTAWELMDTAAKPTNRVGIGDVLSLVAFSIVTAGVLPLMFFSMARARRRRLRHFLREGTPAVAEVLGIRTEPTAFAQELARVSYQFEADGFLHRDTDQVLPAIADRWQPGDRVHILYLPHEVYDSVVISVS